MILSSHQMHLHNEEKQSSELNMLDHRLVAGFFRKES
jgi:hypothetical protein